MKVLITGSRNWSDKEAIEGAIARVNPDIIIEGGASGADAIAREYAQRRSIKVIEVKADWDKYGKQAGPIRNSAMIAMKPDLVLAFSKDLSKNKGTSDTVKKAIAENIKVCYNGHYNSRYTDHYNANHRWFHQKGQDRVKTMQSP